ncbi:MAG: enoyl-CoA hydratase/isomerase family protein [Pseudomonadota bacterium]
MNNDILIRSEGLTGYITLNRPAALNALTHQMALSIEKALDQWRNDRKITQIVIDGEGERAFCAGGDLAKMYETGLAGQFDYGHQFWRDEYRLNAKIYHYPKPYIAFMQGFTMGGGVGISCHGSHRIVGETSKIAMPECQIGLVPDVGGSLLLANAPGHCGEYLGTTGTRLNANDAIYCGFADHFIPENDWQKIKQDLIKTPIDQIVKPYGHTQKNSNIANLQTDIDACFSRADMPKIIARLSKKNNDFVKPALSALHRACPLSLACTIDIIRHVRAKPTIEQALEWENRFTSRACQFGDFVEGIRALIIEKDNAPKWTYKNFDNQLQKQTTKMLLPV